MLITIEDDGVLRIYRSVEEAVRDVEALDAEDVFRRIYDETGRCYSISWIRPNQYGRFMAQRHLYTRPRWSHRCCGTKEHDRWGRDCRTGIVWAMAARAGRKHRKTG